MTERKKGSTGNTEFFNLVTASGTPLLGATIASMTLSYTRPLEAPVSSLMSALSSHGAAHAGFKGWEPYSGFAIGSNWAPGLSRADGPDSAYVTGKDKVLFALTYPNVPPAMLQINLVDNLESDTFAVVASNATALGSLATQVGSLHTRVGSAAVNVGSNGIALSSLATQLGSVDVRIQSIATQVGSTFSAVDSMFLNLGAVTLTDISSAALKLFLTRATGGFHPADVVSGSVVAETAKAAASGGLDYGFVQSINENVSSLHARVSSAAVMIGSNAVSIGSLHTRVGSVDIRVGSGASFTQAASIQAGADAIFARAGSLQVQVGSLETRVGSAAVEVASVSISAASLHTRLESLSTQVGSLETRVGSMGVQVASVATQAASLATQVGSVAINAGSLSIAVASAQVGIDVIGISAVNSIRPGITSLLTNLGSAQVGIDSAATSLGSLHTRVGSAAIGVGSAVTGVGSLNAITIAGRMAADAVAVNSDVNAASNLRRGALSAIVGQTTGDSTTSTLSTANVSPAAAVSDQWLGRTLIFDRDTLTAQLRGQAGRVNSMTAAGVLHVDSLSTAPPSGNNWTIQ